MADDPGVIALVPVGTITGARIAALVPAIRAAFGRAAVLAPGMHLPPSAFNPARRQYRSAVLLDELAHLRRPGWERVLGVSDVDLYAPRLNFVFGEADAARGVAVFSLARLHAPSDDPGSEARFARRAATEAVHELGHTWGLGHCDDPRCVMWFSNTLPETDRKGQDFCRRHAGELERASHRAVKELGERRSPR